VLSALSASGTAKEISSFIPRPDQYIVYVWLSFIRRCSVKRASICIIPFSVSTAGSCVEERQQHGDAPCDEIFGQRAGATIHIFGTTYFLMFFALTYLKQGLRPWPFPGRTLCRGTAYTACADDEEEGGKLALVDCDECREHSAVFVKHYVFTSVYY